jgi:hypothetical protein
MPRQPARIPYVGREALTEALLPEPSEDETALQRLESENSELRDQVRHLEAALKAAGTILAPYCARLGNGRG